jgi:hypothetical protein
MAPRQVERVLAVEDNPSLLRSLARTLAQRSAGAVYIAIEDALARPPVPAEITCSPGCPELEAS